MKRSTKVSDVQDYKDPPLKLRAGRPPSMPWRKLKVGQSFFVPYKKTSEMSCYIIYWNKVMPDRVFEQASDVCKLEDGRWRHPTSQERAVLVEMDEDGRRKQGFIRGVRIKRTK